jgi:hypothetical protein
MNHVVVLNYVGIMIRRRGWATVPTTDDPNQIDTFAKVIESIKKDLHAYIDNPTNETASALYPSMGALPFKYKGYDYWNHDADGIHELREYMSMLFQLFDDYFQGFIKEGLRIDRIVEKEALRDD